MRALGIPLLDLGLAVGCTSVAILIGREEHQQWLPLDTTGYVLTVLANMPIAFRRRAPIIVVLCCSAAWLAFIHLGYFPALNVYGCLVAYYTVASVYPPKVAIPLGGLGSAIWFYAGVTSEGSSMASVLAMCVMFTAVIWKFGDNARRLALQNREMAVLSEQLRAEQAERARQAIIEERMRIAGEVHDIVAHHLSVVSVQANLSRYVFASDPQAARDAMDVIAMSAREGQEQLRVMLGLLRAPMDAGGEMPASSSSGLAHLGELVARVRAAGLPVDVRVTGPIEALPPGHDLCAYRVIQESLTNILKHAMPAAATITVERTPGELEVRVINSRRPVLMARAPRPADIGSGTGVGHGLIGMRRRAEAYGGTLSAGPRGGGGFEVALWLPIPAAEASEGLPREPRQRVAADFGH